MILNEFLELNPEDAETNYLKGKALFSLKKYDDAIFALNISIELNPNFEESHLITVFKNFIL